MTLFQSIGILLSICGIAAYLNQRWKKWPPVLAMTLASMAMACFLIFLGKMNFLNLDEIKLFVNQFDFSSLVLEGLLGLLLFAGALFVDVEALKKWWKPIAVLATLGVMISTTVIGTLLWLILPLFDLHLSIWWCMLFGALISPTDPIAALAIVRKANAPQAMETKLVGESLFNDAAGVMLFLIILSIIQTEQVSAFMLTHEFIISPVMGIGIGVGLGMIAKYAVARIDHHPTEILITLALATSVYGLAQALSVSGPIAAVSAGLVLGQKTRDSLMSDQTRQYLDAFWESADEVLNAILFALMGLTLLVIDMPPHIILIGALIWLTVLVGRSASVWMSLIGFKKDVMGPNTFSSMVWGGLRGGICLALASAIPAGPQANIIASITFIVVAISALAQGLTLERVLKPKN